MTALAGGVGPGGMGPGGVGSGGVGTGGGMGGLGRLEPADPRLAAGSPPALRPWNEAAVLTAADVHVAARLCRLYREDDSDVALAAALAVRAVRFGHVCADVASVATTATSDLDQAADLSGLPWPAVAGWLDALAASPLVAVGDDNTATLLGRPLRLVGSLLYLDRYWRQERQVAADLVARAARPVEALNRAALADGLDRLFPFAGDGAGGSARGPAGRSADGPDLARLAAAVAVTSRLAIVAGGPGTGKTTAVARILALLDEQAAAVGQPPPRVALAAPTGKAAARLAEAVHEEAGRLDISEGVRDRLHAQDASTLHRLLGWRPDSASRFRHDRHNRLPHDVVVVDETSMLSLSLMARLTDAVRPEARLVLVGDPQQLASVEAGAVLGDVVGPAAAGLLMTEGRRRQLETLTGVAVPARNPAPGPPGPAPGAVGDGIVVLRQVHRFGGGIAELASAVAAGAGDAATSLLRSGRADLRWVDGDDEAVRADVVAAGSALAMAARAGDAAAAFAALGSVRVLCAYRHGPGGVATWNTRIERWLRAAVPGYAAGEVWYPGRPLLVTRNDYELQLYNGDTGVVVAGGSEEGRPVAVFERRGRLWPVPPTRLGAVETVHAMTVHKSQGSQFDEVVIVLPDEDGPILSRELLYTAVTRARRRVTVVGTEPVLAAAVARPVARASGLRRRLWGV